MSGRNGSDQGSWMSAPTRFLAHGYWSYPDPAPRLLDLIGQDARLVAGFEHALEAEATGREGAVLAWARAAGVPPAAWDVVREACAQGDFFDDVEVANGNGPATAGGAFLHATLHAARRNRAIQFRLTTGQPALPVAYSREPLDASVVYRLIAGPTGTVVKVALQMAELRYENTAPSRRDLDAFVDQGEWMGHVVSRFYDFSVLETHIRVEVLKALLAHYDPDPEAG